MHFMLFNLQNLVIYLDFYGWLMFLNSDFSDEYSVPA